MLTQIFSFLVDVVTSFFVYLLLARFLFQWLRVPFRNPFGQFIIEATNWMVMPARKVIPALFGLDFASLLLAWLIQGLAIWAFYAIAGLSLGSAPEVAAGVIAGLALIDLVRNTVIVLIVILLVQAVLSWVSPHSPIMPVFDAMTRPFLRPIRRVVPPLASVDLSPLILIVVLQILLIPLAHGRALLAALF